MSRVLGISCLILALGPFSRAEDNVIECKGVVKAKATATSEDAYVEIGARLNEATCGIADAKVDVYAEDVAKAYAEAFVSTVVSCEGQGNVTAGGKATGTAQANATATARALAVGFASVTDCTGCEAEVHVIAEKTEQAFVSASASLDAEIEIVKGATGRAFDKEYEELRSNVETATQAAIGNVFLEISRTASKCEVRGCAIAGDEVSCCKISLEGDTEEIVENAEVKLEGGVVANVTCGESAEGTFEMSAQAIGTAFARAIVEGDAWCSSTFGSEACAWGRASITALASAWARAFAKSWASASNGCGCIIDQEVTADSLATILAEATAELQLTLCVESGGFANIEAIVEAYQRKHVTAIADVVARAIVNPDKCLAINKPCTRAGGEEACCEVSVTTMEEIVEENGLAKLDNIVLADAELCGHTGDLKVRKEYIASAIAKAHARAVIEVGQNCETSQNSSVCASTSASLSAAAAASARAVVSVIAEAQSSCKCTVTAEQELEAVQDLFVKAYARLQDKTCAEGGGKIDEKRIEEEFAQQEALVLATILAEAVSADGCVVKSVSCAEAGASKACCEATANAFPAEIDLPKLQAAGRRAATEVCDGALEADAAAVAITDAWAQAFTSVNGKCTKAGNATACTVVDAEVVSGAHLVADAFVDAWAAGGGCACAVNEDSTRATVHKVLTTSVEATKSEFCANVDDDPGTSNVYAELMAPEAADVAAALLEAAGTAAGEGCPKACPMPGKCIESGDESTRCAKGVNKPESFVGCCDPEYECRRQNPGLAFCRKIGSELDFGWDNTVVPCTA